MKQYNDWSYYDEEEGITISRYSGTDARVEIPETIEGRPVVYIGCEAFNGCTSLTSITIPNSIIWIGTGAFYKCINLTGVTIPKSVTRISDLAFSGCKSLTDIAIPDSMTMIDGSTFEGCTSLTSVTIPNSVTEIGWNAFAGCTNLTSATFEGTTEQWESVVVARGNDALLNALKIPENFKSDSKQVSDDKAVEPTQVFG